MGRVEACWRGEWRLAGGESGGLLEGRVEVLFPSSSVSLCLIQLEIRIKRDHHLVDVVGRQ